MNHSENKNGPGPSSTQTTRHAAGFKNYLEPWSQWRRATGCLLLVYAIGLLTGTHIPNPQGVLPIQTNDKLLHFGAYCGLAFLMVTWRSTHAVVTWRVLAVVWCVAASIGVFDELTQQIPRLHRTADIADWFADVSGAAAGLLAWHLLRCVIARWKQAASRG